MSLQITHAGIFSQGMIQWDSDAVDYLARVAIADSQALETSVALAVNDLFIALKDPAFPTPTLLTHWQAVLAGQFLPLCGARTLAGALLPLHVSMPTPSNTNFIPGDYNRKTGLKGDGTGKFIGMGIIDDAIASNSSIGVWQTEAQPRTASYAAIGSSNSSLLMLNTTTSSRYFRVFGDNNQVISGAAAGYWAASRFGDDLTGRYNSSDFAVSNSPGSATGDEVLLFCRTAGNFSPARQVMGHISESVDLVRMESVLTAYLSALNAAIP